MKSLFAKKSIRAFSLIEVMVAALIFTLLAVSTTTMFVQNQRMIVLLRYRTHVTNSALNILEQLRLYQFSNLKAIHDSATTTTTLLTSLVDPYYSRPSTDPYPATGYPFTGVLDSYRPVPLNLNVLDGVQKNTNWATVNLPLEASATAPTVQVRYWLTLNQNISASTPVVEVYEIVLIYQWKNPAQSSASWQSGTVRLTVPNPGPASS